MKVQFLAAVLFCILSYQAGFSQDDGWKNYKMKDKSIRIYSRIQDSIDASNSKIQVVEYKSAKIVNLPLNYFVETLDDVASHKRFLEDTQTSEIIRTISEDEWVIYYFFNSHWPAPEADCVTTMKRIKSNGGKTVTYRGIATPDQYEDKEVKRMALSDVTYEFSELEKGMTKVSIYSKFSPVIKAPKWLVNAWFPKGPAKTLERLIEVAGN